MSYLALYRKYRPNNFEGLIGQEHIVKTLVNQIKEGRLGHAYLFTGTRGTGKTSAAKIFAKAINCTDNVNGSPCNKCASCLSIADPSNLDVIEIDAASNNGVNEIRDLREKVQYPPVNCKYKVYIIDEVHMLTGAAFNALLKTLEEPPKHAVFILATTEVHKIPATILSRCMRFDFRLISIEKIAQHISKIYDELNKKYEKEAIYAIAKAGEGSIRDALSIADTALSYSSGILKYDDVLDILGSSNYELILELTKSLILGNTGEVLTVIDKLSSLGKSMGILIKDVTSLIRDLLVVKTCKNANSILALPVDKFNKLEQITESVSEQRLLRMLELFSNAEGLLKYSNHPRVLFESCAVKAAKPDTDYNIDALVARINDLELKLNNKIVVASTAKQEVIKEKQERNEEIVKIEVKKPEQDERVAIYSVGVEELRGKLLTNLRKHGSELLWNLLQNVKIEIVGNVLIFTASNSGDLEILDKMPSRERIEQALEDFLPFELQVKLSENESALKELDEATERIKNIFGDDIVIIKD